MKTFTDTLDSLWQVLLIGLAFGAGLPIIFAFGIRFLSTSDVADGNGAAAKRSNLGLVAGTVCIVLVAAAIVAGILFIMKDFLANDLGIHLF